MLHLAWEIAYGKKIWTKLMHIRFLKSNYHKYMFFKSSSIWHGIKDAYDVVLENTF